MAAWLFDVPLLVTLLWLAWKLLSSPELFTSIVLFIAFGLLMAIAWARLGAADIALAEAAIGAGLTGTLFLSALKDVRVLPPAPRPSSASRALLVALGALIFAVLAWSLVRRIPGEGEGLGPRVSTSLPQSGAQNPVTAVLLNFRAYDTLLEVTVLLLAVLPLWSAASRQTRDEPPGPVLLALVQLVVPLTVLIGGYLLWLGTTHPGGAFQGGAMIATACVLLLLSNKAIPDAVPNWVARFALSIGAAVFVLVAIGVMATGRNVLEYPQDSAGLVLLVIECALVVSTAATFTALFTGGSPRS